jgi:hypothetical protein
LHGDDEQVLDGSWRKLFGENGGGEEPKRKKQKTGDEDED